MGAADQHPSGTHVFAAADEEKEDRNPYYRLDFRYDEGAGYRLFTPERVQVTITRADPAGGRIEGTIDGTLRDSAGDHPIVTIAGTFSVVRVKDRIN